MKTKSKPLVTNYTDTKIKLKVNPIFGNHKAKIIETKPVQKILSFNSKKGHAANKISLHGTFKLLGLSLCGDI